MTRISVRLAALTRPIFALAKKGAPRHARGSGEQFGPVGITREEFGVQPDVTSSASHSGSDMTQTGEGLYEWKNGKPVKSGNGARGDAGMVDRLILPLLDACVDCLREGLVEGIDVLEGAVVFATGFAPFRGGPLHYAQTQGPADIVPALEALAKQHGGRFKPDLGWSRLEKKP